MWSFDIPLMVLHPIKAVQQIERKGKSQRGQHWPPQRFECVGLLCRVNIQSCQMEGHNENVLRDKSTEIFLLRKCRKYISLEAGMSRLTEPIIHINLFIFPYFLPSACRQSRQSTTITFTSLSSSLSLAPFPIISFLTDHVIATLWHNRVLLKSKMKPLCFSCL